MKKLILTLLCASFITALHAQTDSLLTALLDTAAPVQKELLPPRMLFTQRLMWGEKGLLHFGKPLTEERRVSDLKIRRTMLVTHQVLGLATMGGLLGQAIVGPRLYKNGNTGNLKEFHEGLAAFTNTTYSLTAVMSIFAPPPMVSRDHGITPIRLHKWLAILHMSGMIATNIFASQLEGAHNPNIKAYHRAAAFTTFAAYTAALITIKLK